MSKTYLMRVENNEQTIAKVMDIAGYSHILHDVTYYVDGTTLVKEINKLLTAKQNAIDAEVEDITPPDEDND